MRFALVLLLALTGCSPIYSPPIRGLHLGMPDRVSAGELEVGAEAAAWGQTFLPATGGAHFSYGISDLLAVEGGANLNLVEGLWATGWTGVRFIRRRWLGNGFSVSGDLEFGLGGGVGGRDAARSPWYTQGAFGVYDGVGLGIRWKWLGAFARARADASVGTLAPSTLWATYMAGLEAKAFDHLVIAASAGAVSYRNQAEITGLFALVQFSAAWLFDLTE
ncbi:MAG: hypothetical protein QM817_23315 [Archangium sp.]